MAKTKAELEAELDALAESVGPLVDITTDGPQTDRDGAQDVPVPDALLAKLVDIGDDQVRTVRGAIEWARGQVRNETSGWSGMCLRFVRSCFGVDPLYPDAKTAWLQADRKHREPDVRKWPRGHAGFFEVGEHWHVVLTLGTDEHACISNDTQGDDQVHRARLTQFAPAWGAVPLGYTDDINGEIAPAVRRPRKPQGGREWRIQFLRRAWVRARAQGHTRRAQLLRKWMLQLKARA